MSWFMTADTTEFLANPVSNALYERLGYRAVEDRVVLSFEPPVTLHP
jgi:hypothetical protein